MQKKLFKKEQETEYQKGYAWKCFFVFLIGWLGLKISASLVQLIVMIFENVPINEAFSYILTDKVTQAVYDALSPNWASMLVNSLAYLMIFVGMCAILNKNLIEYLRSFKKGKAYLAGLIGFFLIITFNNVYSELIRPLYPVTDNVNEESLDSIITIYPLLSILVFGILGPICEELTYRAGLFTLLKKKNKMFAYVTTIIIFGFIHFAFESIVFAIQKGDSSWLINELLNMPTYMFAAAVFIYLFDNFGFAGSASAHIINNLTSILAQILLSIL